jgi:hypothetical protein
MRVGRIRFRRRVKELSGRISATEAFDVARHGKSKAGIAMISICKQSPIVDRPNR